MGLSSRLVRSMFAKPSLFGRLRRVAEMSRDEIAVRTTQEVLKRLDMLRASARIRPPGANVAAPFESRGHFFFPREKAGSIVERLGAALPHALEQTVERAERILQHRFDLLGYENLNHKVEIDWHCDPVHRKSAPRIAWFKVPYLDFEQVGDHKITWELNRHQYFVTLAKAYRFTEHPRYAEELFRQWYHWREQNPYPIGINWASSLEVAFRTLSWLWVWHLLEGSPVVPQPFAVDLHRALILNGRHIERYLSTYFAPNTHLLGEAVALFFIGTLAPWSPAVQRWQHLGWRIILREAQRQVQPDGMHFEQSIHYHVYAVDFFLHARILADRNGTAIPASFDQTIEGMLEALCALRRSGPLPQFGDDDGGRVFDGARNLRRHMSDPLAVGAALYNRADFKEAAGSATEETFWLLGTAGAERFDSLPDFKSAPESFALQGSGIHVMSASSSAEQQLVIDAGPQGPGWAGHGHADALSIQLALNGLPILIDPGTYTYSDVAGERGRFRETGSHNTVRLDGASQAEPAGSFKWNALAHGQAERWITGNMFDFFVGSHSGYSRLARPVLHRRYIFYLKPDFWLIRDVLEGQGSHQVEVLWNFAPGALRVVPGGFEFAASEQSAATLLFAGVAAFVPDLSQGWYSPTYGRREPCPVLRFSTTSPLPAECATAVIPHLCRNAKLETFCVNATERTVSVHHYRLSIGGKTHEMFFSNRAGDWQVGQFASDARFVYCPVSSGDNLQEFAICDGTYLDVNGERRSEGSDIRISCPIGFNALRRLSIRGCEEDATPPSARAMVENVSRSY